MKFNEKIKYLFLGMLVMALFSTMVVPAMAAMLQKQITVSTGVNIYVDDVKLNSVDSKGQPVEGFIYNGTTYLPVRAVANAVGKAVTWDGKTQSVYLGKHDSEEPAIMLSDLDYFDKTRYGGFGIADTAKDNLGNTYHDAIYSKSGSSKNWQTYYLNGMYSKMKGRFILKYNERSMGLEESIRIYADDKLVYVATMTGGTKPIDFEVDLTGVLELKVEFNVTHINGVMLVDTGLYQ